MRSRRSRTRGRPCRGRSSARTVRCGTWLRGRAARRRLWRCCHAGRCSGRSRMARIAGRARTSPWTRTARGSAVTCGDLEQRRHVFTFAVVHGSSWVGVEVDAVAAAASGDGTSGDHGGVVGQGAGVLAGGTCVQGAGPCRISRCRVGVCARPSRRIAAGRRPSTEIASTVRRCPSRSRWAFPFGSFESGHGLRSVVPGAAGVRSCAHDTVSVGTYRQRQP